MLISLIGLPGVGKSAIGRRLAQRLALAFVDCDALLEKRCRSPIRELFEAEGEDRFRDLEATLLAELVFTSNAVIATGGGVVVREANRQLLRTRTVCVYLNAQPDALIHRLKNDTKRPLLQVADPEARLRELSSERQALYRAAATFELETRGQSLNELVDAILQEVTLLKVKLPATDSAANSD